MGPKAHIPLGFAPFPPLRRHGPLWGAVQPTKGLVPLHKQPIGPSGAGGPSRWTPGTLSVVPVQYRYTPEHFRRPNKDFAYINLRLRTIPELLVTSRISSGTPNNIR